MPIWKALKMTGSHGSLGHSPTPAVPLQGWVKSPGHLQGTMQCPETQRGGLQEKRGLQHRVRRHRQSNTHTHNMPHTTHHTMQHTTCHTYHIYNTLCTMHTHHTHTTHTTPRNILHHTYTTLYTCNTYHTTHHIRHTTHTAVFPREGDIHSTGHLTTHRNRS